MSSKKKTPDEESENNPGDCVTEGHCASRQAAMKNDFHESLIPIKEELKTIKTALIGEDMQGGIVKKLGDLESGVRTRRTMMEWIKPIVIALVTTAVTYVFVKLLGV